MKIAYISPIFYSDVDLSFLHEMGKIADIYYFIPIGPLKNSAAINIEKIYPKDGIFPASIYPELKKFEKYINLNKTYIINRTAAHISYPRNLLVYLKLFHFLNESKFDVIHITNFLMYPEYPLFWLKKKIILSVHDPIPHVNDKSIRSFLQRKISFMMIDNFIIFNKKQRNDFINYYSLQNKRVYTSQLSAYKYLNMYVTDKPPIAMPYILFFGWIRKGKGLEYLLPAMKEVHNLYPEYSLVIAGKGTYYFDVNPYKNLPYIHFINHFVPDEDLANIVANCEFTICPYTEATQSGVVMTAFAFSKPVVATNVGGMPEMVKNNLFGLIVPPKDSNSIAEAISKLINSKHLVIEMSSNINKSYSQGGQSWSIIAQEVYSTCYKEIENKL